MLFGEGMVVGMAGFNDGASGGLDVCYCELNVDWVEHRQVHFCKPLALNFALGRGNRQWFICVFFGLAGNTCEDIVILRFFHSYSVRCLKSTSR